MKHRNIENIPPERRLGVEEKLKEKGLKFVKVPLVKFRGCIGVFCPDLTDIFVNKNYCKKCPKWLGGSGKFYFCLDKEKGI